ncbi:MAG TPA: hypothetical protein VFM18_04990 [Methanosarcina sp.]|nr:hypothetical protein [Methanosarcina sp.]
MPTPEQDIQETFVSFEDAMVITTGDSPINWSNTFFTQTVQTTPLQRLKTYFPSVPETELKLLESQYNIDGNAFVHKANPDVVLKFSDVRNAHRHPCFICYQWSGVNGDDSIKHYQTKFEVGSTNEIGTLYKLVTHLFNYLQYGYLGINDQINVHPYKTISYEVYLINKKYMESCRIFVMSKDKKPKQVLNKQSSPKKMTHKTSLL